MMEIRDSVHGLVRYNALEAKILDQGVMQRLRGIKQLALCSLVYPGAVHTRFDHSLGVMHLAGRIAAHPAFDFSTDDRQLVRLAGLVHDIGHGPFSHVSENVLERVACAAARDILELDRFGQFHEAITAAVIRERLRWFIPESLLEPLTDIFQKGGSQGILKGIISGPMDADKMDYLLRDSLFTGVKYGVFDLEKVLESLGRVSISTDREQVGIDEGGVHAVEQFLLARYHMRVQVYFHRVRRITDAMLVRGIEVTVEQGVTPVRAVYMCEEPTLDSFLESDDFRLSEAVICSTAMSRGIFEALRRRNLWKEMFAFSLSEDKAFPDDLERQSLRELDRNRTRRLEEVLAREVFYISPEYVIVDKQTARNPTFRDPVPRFDPDSLIVLAKEGNVVRRKGFEQVSVVFANPAEPFREWIYVYAPYDGTKEERKEFSRKREEIVREVFIEEARKGL